MESWLCEFKVTWITWNVLALSFGWMCISGVGMDDVEVKKKGKVLIVGLKERMRLERGIIKRRRR